MTVSLLERQQAFGAPSLLAMRRGAGYVPDIPQNAGVPTSPPISLSQLAGAVKYVPVSATASPGAISNDSASKGTFTIGTVTVNASGGNGSYTYSAPTLVSGSSSGPNSYISYTQSGNQYTFNATNIQANTDHVSGTWQVTVSDGQTSTNVTFTVSWN